MWFYRRLVMLGEWDETQYERQNLIAMLPVIEFNLVDVVLSDRWTCEAEVIKDAQKDFRLSSRIPRKEIISALLRLCRDGYLVREFVPSKPQPDEATKAEGSVPSLSLHWTYDTDTSTHERAPDRHGETLDSGGT